MRGRKFDLSRYQLEAQPWRGTTATTKDNGLADARDRYGYEQQKCVMTIEGNGLENPEFLSVLDFRNIETLWITGKLILIKLDVGHVAGVDAIYDAEKDMLIYC